jgi:hypothetical protein
MRSEVRPDAAAREVFETLRNQNPCSSLPPAGYHQKIDNNLHRLIQAHDAEQNTESHYNLQLFSVHTEKSNSHAAWITDASSYLSHLLQTACSPRTTTPQLPWTHYHAIILASDFYRSNQSLKRRDLKCGDRGL